MLITRAMNAIFFGIKLAFHSTLRITRPWLRRAGLTSARFDMLWSIREHGEMRQSELRRTLGVTAPTISRMLRSLEDIGLITRRKPSRDTRQRAISLTPAGLLRLRRAAYWLMGTGIAQLAVDSALAADRWPIWSHCFEKMENLEAALIRIRANYGDIATLYYPWHPDD
jgi:DNA-binding MarR family transcriptional regulator